MATIGNNDQERCLINKLPVEVISRIFEAYVGQTAISTSFCDAPIVLAIGAVCRLWRNVAWSTPSLWTVLYFVLTSGTTKTKVDLAIEWITRSGNLPLEIYIMAVICYPKINTEPLIFPLVDIINQHLGRCRVLDLNQLTSMTMSRFSAIEGPSLLEDLYIHPEDMDGPLTLGENASPTRLNITYVHLHLLIMNWRNLTEISAHGLRMSEIMDTLRLAPQLRICYYNCIESDSTSTTAGESTYQTHLKIEELTLVIGGEHGGDSNVAAFFRQTTFPNLDSCHIGWEHGTFPTQTFTSFISRSACAITMLTIQYNLITSDDLIRIGKALLSVEYLSITPFHNTRYNGIMANPHVHLDGFFTALCQGSRSKDSILFPSLCDLDIISHNAFNWKLLLILCDSRRHNPPQLTTSTTEHISQTRIGTITITRVVYATDRTVIDHSLHASDESDVKFLPGDLIESWETFKDLLELGKNVRLNLSVDNADNNPADLFDLSYRKLCGTSGGPPDVIRQNEMFEIWRLQNAGVDQDTCTLSV
ncbi:hypothetical protein JR316_0013206 [Psilocybe cubensis]|uniref:Uncharacterized protein n=2 Tax=Psilocybe cubensis TaxID=181762 RepID=A0ACB8GGG1_PSICU|nr:hypothetical protein JR316_0013206 [Psilocybe cubensis]KAH9474741.1 hypothetical protein JR316_0013206 [Psilocybe cubensis]